MMSLTPWSRTLEPGVGESEADLDGKPIAILADGSDGRERSDPRLPELIAPIGLAEPGQVLAEA
jgi:hypothetical protein